MDAEWKSLGLAAPARRALVNAGITKLSQLTKWRRDDIANLHGMGPNALTKLDDALKSAGKSFKK